MERPPSDEATLHPGFRASAAGSWRMIFGQAMIFNLVPPGRGADGPVVTDGLARSACRRRIGDSSGGGGQAEKPGCVVGCSTRMLPEPMNAMRPISVEGMR